LNLPTALYFVLGFIFGMIIELIIIGRREKPFGIVHINPNDKNAITPFVFEFTRPISQMQTKKTVTFTVSIDEIYENSKPIEL